jgi:hypothetical protein
MDDIEHVLRHITEKKFDRDDINKLYEDIKQFVAKP